MNSSLSNTHNLHKLFSKLCLILAFNGTTHHFRAGLFSHLIAKISFHLFQAGLHNPLIHIFLLVSSECLYVLFNLASLMLFFLSSEQGIHFIVGWFFHKLESLIFFFVSSDVLCHTR